MLNCLGKVSLGKVYLGCKYKYCRNIPSSSLRPLKFSSTFNTFGRKIYHLKNKTRLHRAHFVLTNLALAGFFYRVCVNSRFSPVTINFSIQRLNIFKKYGF